MEKITLKKAQSSRALVKIAAALEFQKMLDEPQNNWLKNIKNVLNYQENAIDESDPSRYNPFAYIPLRTVISDFSIEIKPHQKVRITD